MNVVDGSALSIAVGAGILAAVNPCGFALLPAYLTAFVGDDSSPSRRAALGRALRATLALTLGFMAVFAAFGLFVMPVASQVLDYLPAFTVVVGLVLAAAGGWVLSGRPLRAPALRGRRVRQARPLVASWPTMIGVGASYAITSLGCTLAPFLAVVVTNLRSADPIAGVELFAAYAVGMGLVVAVASTAVALARSGVIRAVRRSGGIAYRVGGLVLVISGLYVAWYGAWELRVLHGGNTNDPIISVAIRSQIWLAGHAQQLGPAGLALVLVLLIAIALTPNKGRKALK